MWTLISSWALHQRDEFWNATTNYTKRRRKAFQMTDLQQQYPLRWHPHDWRGREILYLPYVHKQQEEQKQEQEQNMDRECQQIKRRFPRKWSIEGSVHESRLRNIIYLIPSTSIQPSRIVNMKYPGNGKSTIWSNFGLLCKLLLRIFGFLSAPEWFSDIGHHLWCFPGSFNGQHIVSEVLDNRDGVPFSSENLVQTILNDSKTYPEPLSARYGPDCLAEEPLKFRWKSPQKLKMVQNITTWSSKIQLFVRLEYWSRN